MTSSGTCRCTGPPRPAIAAKAASSAGARSPAVRISVADSAMPRTRPSWSGSSCRWPSPRPCTAASFTPEITSIGTESARACAIGVRMLVTPGPVMTKATPGLPDTRA